jgi:2-polyprenyl-3-methyl-5-hydroxy-6-metoxy-1,4-benzoquinol methylase
MNLSPARACPVCDGERKKILFSQKFDALSDGCLTRGYDVVVCLDCGFAFADGLPPQSSFDRYYAEMSKYEYEQRGGQESPADLARFEAIAEEARPFIPSTDSYVLDLGCSTGRLLAILREKGFTNVCGLDPAPGCAREARELYDVPVFTGSLAENNLPPRPFDFIVMIGVLEHIRDLDPALATLSKMLRPSGRILMEVPDATGFADWPDAPFQQFSTEHICFFSSISLTNLMARGGFKLIHEHVLWRHYTPSTVMPVASNIYERAEDLAKGTPTFDTATRPALERYIEQSRAVENRIHAVIDEIVSSGRAILVWGVGTHTQRLMETSRLSKANVVAFIDSNAKYQSRTLHGLPIIAPSELRSRPEPVLISSRVFQGEIAAQIRDELKCPNELLQLYQV